jgi:hypothetical protein
MGITRTKLNLLTQSFNNDITIGNTEGINPLNTLFIFHDESVIPANGVYFPNTTTIELENHVMNSYWGGVDDPNVFDLYNHTYDAQHIGKRVFFNLGSSLIEPSYIGYSTLLYEDVFDEGSQKPNFFKLDIIKEYISEDAHFMFIIDETSPSYSEGLTYYEFGNDTRVIRLPKEYDPKYAGKTIFFPCWGWWVNIDGWKWNIPQVPDGYTSVPIKATDGTQHYQITLVAPLYEEAYINDVLAPQSIIYNRILFDWDYTKLNGDPQNILVYALETPLVSFRDNPTTFLFRPVTKPLNDTSYTKNLDVEGDLIVNGTKILGFKSVSETSWVSDPLLIVEGNNSAILGGVDNKIVSTANRSIILGGSGLTATQSDTVYVQNIVIQGSIGLKDILLAPTRNIELYFADERTITFEKKVLEDSLMLFLNGLALKPTGTIEGDYSVNYNNKTIKFNHDILDSDTITAYSSWVNETFPTFMYNNEKPRLIYTNTYVNEYVYIGKVVNPKQYTKAYISGYFMLTDLVYGDNAIWFKTPNLQTGWYTIHLYDVNGNIIRIDNNLNVLGGYVAPEKHVLDPVSGTTGTIVTLTSIFNYGNIEAISLGRTYFITDITVDPTLKSVTFTIPEGIPDGTYDIFYEFGSGGFGMPEYNDGTRVKFTKFDGTSNGTSNGFDGSGGTSLGFDGSGGTSEGTSDGTSDGNVPPERHVLDPVSGTTGTIVTLSTIFDYGHIEGISLGRAYFITDITVDTALKSVTFTIPEGIPDGTYDIFYEFGSGSFGMPEYNDGTRVKFTKFDGTSNGTSNGFDGSGGTSNGTSDGNVPPERHVLDPVSGTTGTIVTLSTIFDYVNIEGISLNRTYFITDITVDPTLRSVTFTIPEGIPDGTYDVYYEFGSGSFGMPEYNDGTRVKFTKFDGTSNGTIYFYSIKKRLEFPLKPF